MATMDNFLRQTAADQERNSGPSPYPGTPPNVAGYRAERLLGAGGNASVWLLVDRRTGAARALKVYPAPKCQSDQSPQRSDDLMVQLRRESSVLGSLQHPHLLTLHTVVSTDQGPGLLMDYAAGGSLLNLVTARGRLSPGECITVLAPVAQALTHLHSSSVQHGDLSPGNVLFTAEGKPLVGDLGAARLLGEKNAGTLGTEGFSETGNFDTGSPAAADDVYSLAALGWYSLTGRPPAPAKDRVPLSLLVPDVSAELLHVLEAGLQTDWAARPSAAEFAEAVLRSGVSRPLDLVPAVHPSVLPQLLTRRARDTQPHTPRREVARVLERLRQTKAPRHQKGRVQPPDPVGRRRGRQPERPGRRWNTVVPRATAAACVLLGLLLVGPSILSGINRPAEPTADTAPAVPTPTSELSAELQGRLSETDPVKALSALVGVRAMALISADAELLSYVNIADSEAMDADLDLVAELQERGHVFSGLSIRVQEASLADALDIPEAAAAVRATVIMSGYTETDRSGTAVRTVADSAPQELVFVLLRDADLWKIGNVHTADAV